MKTYITSYNQTIFDICIDIYGSLDYLGKLMSDNNISISDYISVGSSILYDSKVIPNTNVFTSGIIDSYYCITISNFNIGNFTTAVSGTGIVTGGCTISWDPVQHSVKYLYQLNTTGITPTTFTGTNIFTNQIVLAGLSINTNYFIYVGNVCSNGSVSNWSLLEFVINPTLFPPLYYIEAGYIISGYFSGE